jgi:hypothetical protein
VAERIITNPFCCCCCRLEVAEQISELLDAAPKKELENILSLVCSIFGVGNALIALFGDRRIYILNTIGGFKVGRSVRVELTVHWLVWGCVAASVALSMR